MKKISLGAACLTVIAVVGCSENVELQDRTADFDVVASTLTSMRDAKADPSQIAVFEDGEVTYEEYEGAINRALDCMRDAGLTVEVLGTKQHNGVTMIEYTAGGEVTSGPKTAVDDCYHQFAEYVDGFWQVSSPDAVAYEAARNVAMQPLLEACLVKLGEDIVPGTSTVEMIQTTAKAGRGSELSDCLGEIGYQEWSG